MIFRFPPKNSIDTVGGGGLQDRPRAKLFRRLPKSSTRPSSRRATASEWFARTTESISYENLSEKVRIGSSNANIHARLVCAFAASGSRLPRRLLNESKHRPR